MDLLNGEGDVTYEEMEFVMKTNQKTQLLSINLKQEITSSKNYYLSDQCYLMYPPYSLCCIHRTERGATL